MKEHGVPPGIQLACSGVIGPNLCTKEVPLAPTARPIRNFTNEAVQARAQSKSDIRDLRRWFLTAAKRSRGGIRPDLPLWRAWVRNLPAFPEPGQQPAI
ncbi:hypothetical protein [Ruegeria marina]|uniref:hypothetical protein n=1 Tax=Ruegeria marina TaxID=639004 RepID=UPI001FDEBF7B|nr:hypothetical protein [Ruegeria marina]